MNSTSPAIWEKYKLQFILIGVGLLVFFNGLFGSFVWDDINQIQSNYLIHSITNIASFFLGSTFTPQNSGTLGGLYYRPMMSTVFSFIYTFFGTQTFPYHLVQLSLHISNTLLLFYLFKKILKQKVAFLLSLIFLIHPMNVESVVYISALEEPLCFLFGIVAVILYMRGHLTIKRTISISLLLLFSLFSKETGILFGLLLIIYYLLYKKKTAWESLRLGGIVGLPVLVYLFLRFAIAKVYLIKLPDVPMMTASLSERFLSMPAIFLFYIKTFFFPKDLFIYQEWMVSHINGNFYIPFFFDVFFLCILGAVGIWIYKNNKQYFPPFLFFLLWFLLGIGFHMQLLPLDMTVADHMFYFPMVGLLGIIGISLQAIKHPSPTLKKSGIYLIALIVVLFSLRTIVRNTNWYNGLSLYGHDLQYQQNDKIEDMLAGELSAAGDNQDAQKHFTALLARNPGQSALYVNLGLTYEEEGNFSAAADTYQKGLKTDDTGVVYTNYARVIMLREGKNQEAETISAKGLQKYPQNTSLMLVNAIALYKLGNKQSALTEVQNAENISHNTSIDQIYQGIQNDNLSL